MVDTGLWDVLLSPGKTERMTLEQLDASFQTGAISSGTLIREPGSNDWKPLYEVAGLEPPPVPEPSRPAGSAPKAPAPAAPAPVPNSPSTAVAAAPVESEARSLPTAPKTSAVTAPEAARAPETRSRPPALPQRRSGPPSKRTGRGVPLPSVPPRDEAPNTLNPKPLTPPRTTSRRVSAPPSAPTSASGSRTRRAPPSILPAPAKPAATSAQPPSTLDKPAPPAASTRRGAQAVGAPNTSADPIKPAPAPVMITSPSPPTAPQTTERRVEPAPLPVAAVSPTFEAPATPPAKPSLRVQAPPLPDNAFTHLTAPQPQVAPAPVPAVSPSMPVAVANVGVPNADAAFPGYGQNAGYNSSPYPATNGQSAPAFPVGFGAPPAQHPIPGGAGPVHVSPMEANPWAPPSPSGGLPFSGATDTTQGLVLEERPLPSARLSKSELAFWAFSVIVALAIICHRNGTLRQWFGPSSHSAYALFEIQVLGKPSIETVAGVRAFLREVDGVE